MGNLSPYILEHFYQASNELLRVLALCHMNTSLDDFTEAVVNGKYSYTGAEWFPSSLATFAFDEFHLFRSYEAFEFLWNNMTQSKSRLIESVDQAGYNGEHIDSRFVNLVSGSIHGENISARNTYAAARYISNPVTLDSMRTDDKGSIISNLAYNPTVFASTHDYLLSHYGSSTVVKRNLAFSSSDNVLLNKIYCGTKSESIREYVENNVNFIELSKV